MRRTSARLTQLRAHCYRTKWRDKQAEEAYWTLVLAQKPRSCINLVSFDAILKDYYTDDRIKSWSEMDNALAVFGTKLSKVKFHFDGRVPSDRIYYVSDFIPEEKPVSRIVDDEPPIKTHPANQAYRDNWDRIFGPKDEPELTTECGCEGAVVRNCPYESEINGQDDQRCKCCDGCAHRCAMEI